MLGISLTLLSIAAAISVICFARHHGIILRPDAFGLEAVPEEMVKKLTQKKNS